MYLNFSQVGGEDMFVYFPVILVGLSVAVLFNPIKMFYFRTRMWLLYSLVSVMEPTPRKTLILHSGACYSPVSTPSNGETSTSATCSAP